MCHFIEQDSFPTTILILGENGAITNGQFVYFKVDNDGTLETRLVDLRKTY